MSRYPSKQLAHIWAQQNKESAKNSNGQFYFNGPVIYSYGAHFPIATFWEAGLVFWNDSSRSITTSKHQSYTRGALGSERVIPVPSEVMREIVFISGHGQKSPKFPAARVKKELTGYYTREITAQLEKAARARSEFQKNHSLQIAQNMRANAEFMATRFKAVTMRGIPKVESFDPAAYKAELAARDAKERKRVAKLAIVEIEKFRAGESFVASLLPETLMRVNGDEVETSRGARFPVDHARHVFPKLQKIRATIQDKAVPVGIAVGHFRIDSVDKSGLKAGCHFIKWPEIDALAKTLGVL